MSHTPTSNLPSILSTQTDWALTKYKQISAAKKQYGGGSDEQRAARRQQQQQADVTDIDMDMEKHADAYGYAARESKQQQSEAHEQFGGTRPALDSAIRSNVASENKLQNVNTRKSVTQNGNATAAPSSALKVSNLSSISATLNSARSNGIPATDHTFRSRKNIASMQGSGGIKTGSKLVALGGSAAQQQRNKPSFMQPTKQARRSELEEHHDLDNSGMFKFGSNLQVQMPSLVLKFQDVDDLSYGHTKTKVSEKQREYEQMEQLYERALQHKTQAKHTQWFMSRLNYGLVFDAAASQANKLRQQQLLQSATQAQLHEQQAAHEQQSADAPFTAADAFSPRSAQREIDDAILKHEHAHYSHDGLAGY